MKSIQFKLHTQQQSGFVLLFALVVSAIIFLVGAGVFSLAFKELLVSSIAKESQKAIFAADSGVECALYTDEKNNTFDGTNTDPFVCFGTDIIPTIQSAGVYQFSVPFLDFRESQVCSIVRVTLDDPQPGLTTVVAQGFNKCTSDGQPVRYPGLTERVYQVTF